jgi:transposase
MNKRYIVTLTAEERQELEALVSRGKQAVWRQTRAWILLQADAGPTGRAWTDERIGAAYGVSAATIYRVRQAFVEEGFAQVLKRKPLSRPRPRKLDGDQEARLIALACSQPPAGRCRWTVRLLADKMVELNYVERVSPETVRQTLKKTC